ncbi:hypothetical protein L1987_13579 [Smallanthus sonchifolius]|uniref:Uncharacterized protein n=1 Tax=Smallanthus sonchifolius TaxID=185202 RepID=A0ACB9JJ22_9ASTR|nr:hypothetical protein L1987_13579 [Smallanthus sonchifolius]
MRKVRGWDRVRYHLGVSFPVLMSTRASSSLPNTVSGTSSGSSSSSLGLSAMCSPVSSLGFSLSSVTGRLSSPDTRGSSGAGSDDSADDGDDGVYSYFSLESEMITGGMRKT